MAATYATLADPVDAVVSLLNSNWSAVASGVGATPTVKASWDMGKRNLKNGDLIRCYEKFKDPERMLKDLPINDKRNLGPCLSKRIYEYFYNIE